MDLNSWKYYIKYAYKRCGAEYDSNTEEALSKNIYFLNEEEKKIIVLCYYVLLLDFCKMAKIGGTYGDLNRVKYDGGYSNVTLIGGLNAEEVIGNLYSDKSYNVKIRSFTRASATFFYELYDLPSTDKSFDSSMVQVLQMLFRYLQDNFHNVFIRPDINTEELIIERLYFIIETSNKNIEELQKTLNVEFPAISEEYKNQRLREIDHINKIINKKSMFNVIKNNKMAIIYAFGSLYWYILGAYVMSLGKNHIIGGIIMIILGVCMTTLMFRSLKS